MSSEIVRRSCPICEACCGIVVEVDRDAGRVVRISGDEEDPRSRGYLCPKAYAPAAVYEDPDRIRTPLIKEAGGFRPASWNEALDLCGERLRAIRGRFGNDAIATYIGNPTGFNLGAMLWSGMFIQMLSSERVFSGATVDQFPKNLSCRVLYGDSWLFPIPDIDRTEYFVVLGANPAVSNGSLMSAPNMKDRLRRMRTAGVKIVVVDPRRTETAEMADQWIPIRPGADAYLLMAMIDTLFAEDLVAPGRAADFTDGIDELGRLAAAFPASKVAAVTGIDADTIRRLTREFAAAERAVLYGRFGTCTAEFGTLTSWLVDAFNLLTGNFDREGGLMFPRPATGQSEPRPIDAGPVPYGRFHSRVRGFPEFDGQLPASELDSAGEQRIRAFISAAGNPVVSTPNGRRLSRALDMLDFMVSVDIYVNETTRHADVILPSLSAFEETNYDFLFQSTAVRDMARYSPRVFEPDPRLKPHWEILAELAARLNSTTVEALDDMMLWAILGLAVGVPGTRCEHVSHEEAASKIGERRGPERLLDLMLRAGPYGDRFEDEADGLSLAKLAAVPHAVDLGALKPRRLPDILKTPGRRIPLADPLLAADVERLTARLDERSRADGLVLVGRRQMRNMNSWLHNVEILARGRNRCTLLVHPEDAARAGIEAGGRARVRSRVGEVVAEVEVSDEMMPGVVSLPHGFGHDEPGVRLSVARRLQPGVNSNLLADESVLDELSGTSVLCGIPVEVEPA